VTEVVILAGGKGTRLKSVVYDRPKPMAEINGVPFLRYLMDFWVQQGAVHFILSVGFMKEFVIEYFGAAYKTIPITYVREEMPLGTGGASILAMEAVSEYPFVLTNGDTLSTVNFRQMIEEHNQFSADLSISVFMHKSEMKYGTVEFDKDGKVTQFAEKSRGLGSWWINGGTYIVTKHLIDDTWSREENISFETEMMPEFINKGKYIYAYQSEAEFIDIGNPEDYLRAESIVRKISQMR